MSQQINLFNPIFLKQKKYFSAIAMAQALGLILIGALLLSVYSRYQFSGIRKEATNTAAQMGLLQTRLSKVKTEYAPPQKSQALEDSVKKTDAEVKSLHLVFDALQKGEIGNREGYSAYLRAFARQIVDGLWLTGFTIVGAGTELGLQGRALRPELVPAYINNLKQEHVIQGKNFSTLEIQLPQQEQSNREHPAGLNTAAAPYVEFDLRSSGISKAAVASDLPPGVKNQ
ncbi:MAG: PilN domain-containing protein [Glaciimonas sp.]|nr:PilN domain-containing protein [Glaciimonas sp.]